MGENSVAMALWDLFQFLPPGFCPEFPCWTMTDMCGPNNLFLIKLLLVTVFYHCNRKLNATLVYRVVFVCNRNSLRLPGSPGTHSGGQADLELTDSHLLLSPNAEIKGGHHHVLLCSSVFSY